MIRPAGVEWRDPGVARVRASSSEGHCPRRRESGRVDAGRELVDRAVIDHLANEQRLLEAMSAEERERLSDRLRRPSDRKPFQALIQLWLGPDPIAVRRVSRRNADACEGAYATARLA